MATIVYLSTGIVTGIAWFALLKKKKKKKKNLNNEYQVFGQQGASSISPTCPVILKNKLPRPDYQSFVIPEIKLLFLKQTRPAIKFHFLACWVTPPVK